MVQAKNLKLFEILKQLGLSSNQSEIFMLILEDKNISISEI